MHIEIKGSGWSAPVLLRLSEKGKKRLQAVSFILLRSLKQSQMCCFILTNGAMEPGERRGPKGLHGNQARAAEMRGEGRAEE